MTTSLTCLLFVLLVSSAALYWATTLKERRIRAEEHCRIRTMQEKVLAALEDNLHREPCFTETLASAAITTGLQVPRIKAQAHVHRQVPEKYRILERLAEQGLGPGDIATALGISSTEAGQLLTLREAGSGEGRPPALDRPGKRLRKQTSLSI